MTGFGQVSVPEKEPRFEVTVRSVNSRFLEIKTHLAKGCLALEKSLRGRLTHFFRRGSIDVYVQRIGFHGPGSGTQIHLNKEFAQVFLEEFRGFCQDLKLDTQLPPRALLRVPGVLSYAEEVRLDSQDEELLLSAVERACRLCVEQRETEGAHLKDEIRNLAKELVDVVGAIRGKQNHNGDQSFEKYQDRIAKKFPDAVLDPARLATELALHIDRLDLNEEVARLEKHLQSYIELVEGQGTGKKLDFFHQELLREVNTIGAKSLDTDLTTEVIRAKGHIERMRELVQNVE